MLEAPVSARSQVSRPCTDTAVRWVWLRNLTWHGAGESITMGLLIGSRRYEGLTNSWLHLSNLLLSLRGRRIQLDSRLPTRSVRSTRSTGNRRKDSPNDVNAVIGAATCERDRLLLRVLWATGGRISEVLALRPMDVQRDHRVLPNRKNPNLTVKRVYLPAGQADLPGALLVWANEQRLGPQAPLFFSRKRDADGGLKAISRVQAWTILKSGFRAGRRARSGAACLAARSDRRACACASPSVPSRTRASDRPHHPQPPASPASGRLESAAAGLSVDR